MELTPEQEKFKIEMFEMGSNFLRQAVLSQKAETVDREYHRNLSVLFGSCSRLLSLGCIVLSKMSGRPYEEICKMIIAESLDQLLETKMDK